MKINESNIFIWILVVINITLTIINFGNLYTFNNKSLDYDGLEIDYGNLNDTEIGIVDNIISEIRLEYKSKIGKITFTKDEDPFGDGILGKNRNGDIYIWYKDFHTHYEEPLRRTICHEILHNIVKTRGEEIFVTDLEKFMPCFYPS